MTPMVEQEFLHELRLIRDSLESLVHTSQNQEIHHDELSAWMDIRDIKEILEELAARTDDEPETSDEFYKHFMEFKGTYEPPFGDKNLLVFICRYCNSRINVGRSTYLWLMTGQTKLNLPTQGMECSREKA